MVDTRAQLPTRSWPAQGQWTYEDWLELPADGGRYEIIDGQLHITSAPSIAHQTTSGNVYVAFRRFADEHRLGRVFAAPVDVRLPGQPVPFQPDLVFVAAEQTGIIGAQEIEGAPDLVAEILSPSNWPYDRHEKLRVYRAAGVLEYWVVDYVARTIEVLVMEAGEYVLLGKWGASETARSQVLAHFEVRVDEVFQGVEDHPRA